MAKHEFGIMQISPKKGQRYDEYEPYKYNCISVDDIYIEKILSCINNIDLYWHTLDIQGKGIAYCGVTLIPPSTMASFISVIENIPELSELKELLRRAIIQNKWIIHFGL